MNISRVRGTGRLYARGKISVYRVPLKNVATPVVIRGEGLRARQWTLEPGDSHPGANGAVAQGVGAGTLKQVRYLDLFCNA